MAHGLHNVVGEKKRIGVTGMVVVGFFWVHGGIYGNEAMLMAGPPLYVFFMLTIAPFVYSLPIALIVAELSTAFPEDGGYVVWVQEACGKFIGGHHAYWVWVIYVVDAAIYPVLVSNYVDTMIPMGYTARRILSMMIIFFVMIINLLGTDVMVKFSSVLALISLLPTVFFTLYGLPQISTTACLSSEGEVDWSLLVSWVLWLYCGFFSLGTLAGDLDRPRRTFIISLSILFPAVLLLNTLPLAVALGVDADPSHYSAGYFNVLARKLAGPLLDFSFQLGANVCLIGLYNAAVLTAERSLFFLCNSHYSAQVARLSVLENEAGSHAPLVRWLFSNSAAGIAPAYIVFNASCAALLVWLPYALLVEFSMLLSVPSILLFMWSFVALRVQCPQTERPFLIPGGLPVAVLITIIPVAISITYAAIVVTEAFIVPPSVDERSSSRDDGSGSQAIQIWSMLGVIAFGLFTHAAITYCSNGPQLISLTGNEVELEVKTAGMADGGVSVACMELMDSPKSNKHNHKRAKAHPREDEDLPLNASGEQTISDTRRQDASGRRSSDKLKRVSRTKAGTTGMRDESLYQTVS